MDYNNLEYIIMYICHTHCLNMYYVQGPAEKPDNF